MSVAATVGKIELGTATVTIPSLPVPVVVSVTFAPSTNCTEPPVLDNVTVCEVEFEVLLIVCNSFVVLPSTSVDVIVKLG